MSEWKSEGRVVWREAMVADLERAKGFYGELFGWRFEDFDMGPGAPKYPMIKLGERAIGGMMQLQADMKMPPYWTSYVSVKDIDASIAAVKSNGGQVPWGPMDVPNVGRMATVMADDGACLSLLQPSSPDQAPTGRPQPGEFCWETLSAGDVEKAKAFWPKVIPNWRVSSGAGMPTFGVGEGMENQVADIQAAQGPVPPNWMTFVVVEKLEPANARAQKLGGKVMMPRIDIPSIGGIAVITDVGGAALGLFEPGGI